MRTEHYAVQLVCKNEDCKKPFDLPDWLTPQHTFIIYSNAKKFAAAIREQSIQDLLSGEDADSHLIETLGRFFIDKSLDRIISCPHCKEALPVHQFGTRIIEVERSA